MKNNKLDIFEQNAEFFERFNNSLEDTAEDRHERTRFTVTGLENKVEFAVSNAQGRIKKAEDDAIANIVDTTQSVGTGKYLREGSAKGDSLTTIGTYYTSASPPPKLQRGMSGVTQGLNFRINNPELDFSELGMDWSFIYYEVQGAYSTALDDIVTFRDMRGYRELRATRRNSDSEWTNITEVITDRNTRADKNNVLHSGTGTPINTLNVSDMADTVVDRDDVTVTSGAVYRALDELRAEIALLTGEAE